jgi:tripartite-type tricarboxylate transporter receptor subunit TctC
VENGPGGNTITGAEVVVRGAPDGYTFLMAIDSTVGAGVITTQLAGELFKTSAGADLLVVPYKGSAPTVQGLLSGDVTMITDGVAANVPHIKSGRFRPLANLGSRPIAALPNVPTLAAEARSTLGAIGLDVEGSSSDSFAACIRTEADRWARVIKQAGIPQE